MWDFGLECRASSVMSASASLLPAQFPGLALLPNERLLSSFRPDIDDSLRFSAGLVLLSDAHLHVRQADGSFRRIPLSSSLELVRHEHAGLTELSFLEHGQRVLCIRYTLAEAAAGHAFVVAFEETRGRPSARPALPELELDDDFALPESAPVGHPLWRLLGFARPRFGKIAIGLGLTLATTAVGLIPPYLTMPLMDMFWGDRYGKLKDPFGHEWSAATHIEDVSPREMTKRGQEAFAQMGGGQ